MWKEAVVASFKVQFRHLPGGTDENHGKSQQNTRCLSRDSICVPPEYKTENLPLELPCSNIQMKINNFNSPFNSTDAADYL
jgi:hypothetical protein